MGISHRTTSTFANLLDAPAKQISHPFKASAEVMQYVVNNAHTRNKWELDVHTHVGIHTWLMPVYMEKGCKCFSAKRLLWIARSVCSITCVRWQAPNGTGIAAMHCMMKTTPSTTESTIVHFFMYVSTTLQDIQSNNVNESPQQLRSVVLTTHSKMYTCNECNLHMITIQQSSLEFTNAVAHANSDNMKNLIIHRLSYIWIFFLQLGLGRPCLSRIGFCSLVLFSLYGGDASFQFIFQVTTGIFDGVVQSIHLFGILTLHVCHHILHLLKDCLCSSLNGGFNMGKFILRLFLILSQLRYF